MRPGKGLQVYLGTAEPVKFSHVEERKKTKKHNTSVIHNPKDNLQVTCHSTISGAGHNLNFVS